MKLVKSLALGSAAALVTMTGVANAADLPGAEPVDYVKVCDIKGSTGFFYIPGTETCLQIGGFARLEMTSGELIKSPGVKETDNNNRTGYRIRSRVWFDARTDTEYGALRTFVRLQFQRETGAIGADQRAQNSDAFGDDSLFDQAFVQFAGLTAGVTDSFWDFKPYTTFQNPFISDRTLGVLAYTLKAGDFSASVSLEDATARYFSGANSAPYSGQQIPDIVANLRVKQGWGEAQLSGVLHRIDPKTGVATGALGNLGDGTFSNDKEWGWGLQAGVKFNLPTANTSDAKGDFVWANAAYTDGGGLSYNGLGDVNNGSGRTQNVSGLNPQRDFVIVGGDIEKTRAFSANLGVLHYWSPKWRSTLAATYIDVDYRKVDQDWRTGMIAGNLVWSPVKKLDIGGELVYVKNMKRANVGYAGGADKDAFVGRLRVQRDF